MEKCYGAEKREAMSGEGHDNSSQRWLIFFFICFMCIMAIGISAIFLYHVNAPEKKPATGGGHGMILPVDGEYAPHYRVWPYA